MLYVVINSGNSILFTPQSNGDSSLFDSVLVKYSRGSDPAPRDNARLEIIHLGSSDGYLPGAQLLHIDDAGFAIEYLNVCEEGTVCIDLEFCDPDGLEQTSYKGLDFLRSISDLSLHKLLWIRSNTRGVTPEILAQASALGATVIWEKQSLLHYKVDRLAERYPELSRAELFQKIGVPSTTLYSHLRNDRNPFLTDRTWAHLCHGLSISEEETKAITNLEVRGFSAEEHLALERQIEEILGYFEDQALVHATDVCDILLTHHPELSASNQSHLETIIRNTMLQSGMEDARVTLWREADKLGKDIRSIPDARIEQGLRHRMIGNMFEEVALLDLQIKRPDYIPQYALSVKRDAAGRVIHTTDIIDLLSVEPIAHDFLRKAYYDAEIASGSLLHRIKDTGYIEVRDTPDLKERVLHFITDSGEPFATQSVAYSLDLKSGRSGKWYAYETQGVPGSDVIYRLDCNASILDPMFDVLLAKEEHAPPLEYIARLREHLVKDVLFDYERAITGIEVKKAGSSNITGIVVQLRRQRDAVLRTREEDPFSIAAQIGRIKVVVLTPNYRLKEAIDKLNEEIGESFFEYDEFSSHEELGATATSLLYTALEQRTLEEAVLLRKFFGRINMEFSADPTIATLSQMYQRDKDTLTIGSRLVASNEPEVFIEHAQNRLQNYFDRQNWIEKRDDKAHKVRALIRDFTNNLDGIARVSEEWLCELFNKHFPDADYNTSPAGVTAMTVYQDYGDREDCLQREMQRFSRQFLRSTRMSQFQLPAELYAAVTRVADRYAPDIIADLETVEGIQDLIDSLEESRLARERAREERATQESNFAVGLVAARLGQFDIYAGQSEFPYDWLHKLSCPLLSQIRSQTGAYDIDDRDALQKMAKAQLLARSLMNYIVHDMSKLEDSAYDVLREWSWANTGKEHELTSRFHCGRSFRADLLETTQDIWQAAFDYQSPLSPQLARFSEKCVAIHSRFINNQSPKLNTLRPDRVDELVKSSRLSSEFNARLERESNSLVERLLAEYDDSDASLEERLTQLTEDTPLLEPEDITGYWPYLVEYCQSIGFVEEEIVKSYLNDFIRKTPILSAISDDLGREYMQCRLMAMIEFPTNPTDLYLERFLALSDLLEDQKFATKAADYMDWGLMTSGDFVRIMMHMSLSTNESALIQSPGSENLLAEYINRIMNGDFESAGTIDRVHRGALYGPLRRIYAIESVDPHIRWIRQFDLNNKNYEHRSFRASDPDIERTGLHHLLEIQEAIKLDKLLEKHREEIDAQLSVYLDQNGNIRQEMMNRRALQPSKNELQRLFILSREAYIKYPERFIEPYAYLDQSRYRGHKHYNALGKSMNYLDRNMPFWRYLYHHAPGVLFRFAEYGINGGLREKDQSKVRKSKSKKQLTARRHARRA